jgi:hypothetical protein
MDVVWVILFIAINLPPADGFRNGLVSHTDKYLEIRNPGERFTELSRPGKSRCEKRCDREKRGSPASLNGLDICMHKGNKCISSFVGKTCVKGVGEGISKIVN